MRIDQLTPGSYVTLRFGTKATGYTEPARFVGIVGTGDDREATFRSANPDGTTYEWGAYRHAGRWAYGSGADYLSLVTPDRVEATR